MNKRKVTIARLLTLLDTPEWLSRDGQIVILARSVRTLGYGCTSVDGHSRRPDQPAGPNTHRIQTTRG